MKRVGLRGRLVAATSLLSLASLGIGFAVVSMQVNRLQQRQLDDALVPAAYEEARDLASDDPPGGAPPVISDRPGPDANDVGPMEKFVAVYWPDGRLASATTNFEGHAPPFEALRHPEGRCFDLQVNGAALRAVAVGIPRHPGAKLLLAVSRADLDGDAAFLARAMLTVFSLAVAWTTGIAWWLVGRVTRGHRAIVATTRRVSAGDLAARVGYLGPTADPEGLGRNVDEMIERLALLLQGQEQFIAQAAHELRSPLTTLYGELSLALRRERDAAGYRQTIVDALDATRRLKLLAEDLLSLARLGTEPRRDVEVVALADVIQAAVAMVSQEARKAGVEINVSGLTAAVAGRGADLERLFRNLIENAIAHSPAGGTIDITSEMKDGAAWVRVTDEGPGVADAQRERIFEPFFRGGQERAGEQVGAGLGLTIARDIARMHGGELRLETRGAGDGARFVVRLPVHPAG